MSIHTGNIPPSLAAVDSIWLSTALKHIHPAPQPSIRKTILKKDQSYETSFVQEPSAWYYNGKWHMIYGCGAGVGYASATSPKGPWTKHTALVFGGGVGIAGAPAHQNIYREGNTLYMTYVDSGANTKFSQATASVDDPKTWTVNAGFAFDPGSDYRSGGLGNTWTLKDGSDYWLFFETSYGAYGWQTGLAKGSSPAGPFTVVQFPLIDLAKAPGQFGDFFGPKFFPVGNPCVFKENGEYIMFAGAKLINGALNDIYRWTAPAPIGPWTVSNGGYPILRRNTQAEVDQTVDPMVAQADNGAWWMFYSQMDNVSGTGSIAAVPMAPALLMYNGEKFDTVGAFADAWGMNEWRTTPVTTTSTYQLANGERLLSDTTSGNTTITLPRAAPGAHCCVVNVGPSAGANTVTVNASGSDAVINSNSALTVGQTARYECWVAGRWSRV